MDTVKESQEITIGKYQCRVVKSNSWWCSNETSRGTNEDIFTQFGLTKKDIWNVLGYESPGGFPQCKSAKDLTKVIEFIMSKDPANQPVNMEAIQAECIKRFPIGCKYLLPDGTQKNILKEDDKTYTIFSNHMVYAHRSGGSLYKDGVYATLISLPEEKSSIPEYVECISKDFFAIQLGTIYKLESRSCSDDYWLEDVDVRSYSPHYFKPSTKAEYEAQFTKKFKVGDYVISDYSYLTLPRYRVSQILEVSDVGRIKLKEGEFNPNDFRLAAPGEIHPRLTEKIEYPMYAYVGDPLPTIKTKPLIENVQSVSVNLRTKKNNNKFKF